MSYIIKILTLTLFLMTICSCDTEEGVFIYEITIENHRFIPEIVYLPEGKKIKLIVHNKDDIVEEFESHALKREKLVPPKGKATIVLPPLKKGEYSFIGEFHADTAQGKIIVHSKDD